MNFWWIFHFFSPVFDERTTWKRFQQFYYTSALIFFLPLFVKTTMAGEKNEWSICVIAVVFYLLLIRCRCVNIGVHFIGLFFFLLNLLLLLLLVVFLWNKSHRAPAPEPIEIGLPDQLFDVSSCLHSTSGAFIEFVFFLFLNSILCRCSSSRLSTASHCSVKGSTHNRSNQ